MPTRRVMHKTISTLVVLNMENFVVLLLAAMVLMAAYAFYRKSIARKRSQWIDRFQFPATITTKLLQAYPHLTDHQAALVIKALREYFQLCNVAGKRVVSMPSQVVDVAWHEFILFTRQYQQFCNKAIGRFLHHTPAEAMKSPTVAQQGIKTAWKIACARELIHPKSPHRLPLLFAIDAELNIPDGFKYALDCKGSEKGDYCGSHIGCSSCAGGCASGSGCSSGCGGGGD